MKLNFLPLYLLYRLEVNWASSTMSKMYLESFIFSTNPCSCWYFKIHSWTFPIKEKSLKIPFTKSFHLNSSRWRQILRQFLTLKRQKSPRFIDTVSSKQNISVSGEKQNRKVWKSKRGNQNVLHSGLPTSKTVRHHHFNLINFREHCCKRRSKEGMHCLHHHRENPDEWK